MDVPQVGELLRVVVGTPEKQSAKWLEAGDIVKVVENNKHIFMVEKLKGGKDDWHMRQCYPNVCWKLSLCRI